MLKIRIPVGYSQIVKVTPKTKDGDDAKIEAGTEDYTSSDDEVAIPNENSSDETEVQVDGKRTGTCEIRTEGDSDLGEGPDHVRKITGAIEVEVYELEAEILDMQPKGDVFKTPKA